MNKVLKKVVAVSLIALMATSVFGCKKSAETGVEGGVHKVEILCNYGSTKSFWEEKVKEFNSTIGKEKKIKIELTTRVDAAYNQQIEVAMQGDQLPDLFSYAGVKKLHELDMIVPLNELDGTADTIKKLDKYMLEYTHKIGDNVYCYPSGMTVRGLVYNKDMFKKAGLVDKDGNPTPPETYDEMVEYAKKLTDESKMQYGIIFPVKWVSWTASDILDAAAPSGGHSGYNPVTGEYDYTVAEPLLKAVMQIKKDGSCYPGAEGMDNDPARAKFSEGQIGMKFAYSFDVGVFNDQFKAKCDWGVAPLPVADKDNRYMQYASAGTGLKVSKRGLEKHGKEVISTVLNWWYSDDMTKELYAQGYTIPCDWETVKDVKLENAKTGWKDFCELTSISMVTPLAMPSSMDGRRSIDDYVVNGIWAGKEDFSVLKEASKAMNEGVKEYQKNNPDMDYSIYTDKNWKSER